MSFRPFHSNIFKTKAWLTHRSKGAPWPRVRSAVPGDRSATACPGSPALQDSPDAGSHCAQNAPTAYGNA